MEDMKNKKFDPENKINSLMIDWKIWSDRYFPIEEKLQNWENESTWVLLKP